MINLINFFNINRDSFIFSILIEKIFGKIHTL